MSVHIYLLSFVGIVRTISEQGPNQSRRNISEQIGTLYGIFQPTQMKLQSVTSVGILA